MARIRSIHPGFASDDRFASVSIAARLFFLLLLTECDDQGIFEWKPITLKMRCFPADNVDIPALLSELTCIDAVCSYEIAGRKLGAVRNFRRFQRPKSPNATHAITPEIGNYVGLSGVISELPLAQPPPFPQKGEIPPQMEDGGGRREEGKKDSARKRASTSAIDPDEFEVWYAHFPWKLGRGHAEKAFVKARKIASLADLVAGADRYAVVAKPEFKCHPATWLNGKRWLDEDAPLLNGNGSHHPPIVGGQLETPERITWRVRLSNWCSTEKRMTEWPTGWVFRECPNDVVDEFKPQLRLKPPPGVTITEGPRP